jgi:hypothetical protein
MTNVLYIVGLLLIVNVAYAQDEDPEVGLTKGHLIGDPSTVAAPILRPQLVHHDHTTGPVIGASAAVVGGLSLVAAWSLYVARQNYRLRPWRELSDGTVSSWETQGAWSFWLGVGASASISASEYLLLPESRDVPTLAWFAGGGGLVLAAVGVGFAVGGTHCGPQVVKPGADLVLACGSGTADSLFGPLLLLTAAPLVNLPLVYLFRSVFAGAPESLSVGPRGVSMTVRF